MLVFGCTHVYYEEERNKILLKKEQQKDGLQGNEWTDTVLPGGDNTFLPIPIDPPEREEKLVTVIAVE